MKMWTVRVWDGYSTRVYPEYGTYEQVVNTLAGFPPSCIWTVS